MFDNLTKYFCFSENFLFSDTSKKLKSIYEIQKDDDEPFSFSEIILIYLQLVSLANKDNGVAVYWSDIDKMKTPYLSERKYDPSISKLVHYFAARDLFFELENRSGYATIESQGFYSGYTEWDVQQMLFDIFEDFKLKDRIVDTHSIGEWYVFDDILFDLEKMNKDQLITIINNILGKLNKYFKDPSYEDQ